MKKPTSNGNDLYQIGNDYPQVVEQYFDPTSYHDGIYTSAVKVGYDVEAPQIDGFDKNFFAQKEPIGLNKRILNVSQSAWTAPVSGEDFLGDDISAISAVSAVFSPDYAVAELSSFPEKKD